MKKVSLLLIPLFVLFMGAKAQNYLLQEGFENDSIPGWTLIDNDGDGNNWYILNNSQSSSGGFNVHSGSGHITSASWSSGVLYPDNWLITPAVNLTSDAMLTFWVAGQDQAWSAEHFSVYLSTTGTTVADFTNTLLYDQVATSVMTEYTVNLSQWTGQTVYIAFRHHNISDMFRINLDDVEITTAPTTPTLSVTPTSMAFSAFVNEMDTKTAMVNAFNLTAGITATTAAPFAVSSDSLTFGSTASLPQTGGTLYVQYQPTMVGLDSGNVTISSTGATDITIGLTGQAVTLASLPYSQDFEDATENNNWCFFHNGVNQWVIDTAANNTADGQHALYVSNDNGVSNTYDNASTSTSWAWRDIDFGVYGEYSLSFDFRGHGESASYDYLKIYLGPPAEVQNSASSTGATIQGATLIGTLYNQDEWHHYTTTLNSGFQGVQRLYLLWWNDASGGSNPPAAIDNIVITGSNCAKPSNPVVSNITAHTADVVFQMANPTDYAWEYALCANGQSPDNVTPVSLSDTTFLLENLESGTTFNLYVRTVCGGNEYSNWSNMTTFTTDPTCTSPQNLTVSNIAGSSAVVTWEPAELGATEYTFAYTEAGQENWVTSTPTENMVVLSGLDPLTTYQVSVTSVCEDGSAPAAVKTFTTHCLAGGEFQIGDGTSTNIYVPSYSFYNYGYSQQIYTSTEMNGASNLTSISMNMANLSQQRTYKIYLAHTSNSTLDSGWVTPTDAQLVYTGPQTLTTGWNTFEFNTPFNYNGTDNLLVIFVDSTGSYVSGNSWYVHDATGSARYIYQDGSPYTLTPPSGAGTVLNVRNNVIFGGNCDSTATCFAPNIYATSTTSETVTLNWVPGYQETSWEVEYSVDTTNWISGGTATASPYTLNNLNGNTDYFIRVRSACGGNDFSDWVVTTAKTTCIDIDILPYTENFDSAGTGSTAFLDCWNKLNTANNSCPYISSTNYESVGSLYFYTSSSSTYNMAIMPPISSTFEISDLMVSFMYKGGYATDRLIVGVMSNPTIASTFVPVDTVYPGTTPGDWVERMVFLNTYTGDGHFIAFKNEYNNNTAYAYVDNLTVSEIPDCVQPSDVFATSSLSDTVTVSWNAGPSATAWEIIYGPVGFDPDSTDDAITISGVTENPYAIGGLSAGVVYDFYVRTDCGADGYSNWSNFPGTGSPYTYVMDVTGNDSISACGITITDDGGIAGNYSNNCEFVLTIHPSDPDSVVSISGTFAGEGNYDYLEIFNGASTNSTMFIHVNSTMNGGISGDEIPFGPYISDEGPITLRFHSDGSVNYPGFVAQTTCIAAPTCPRPQELVSTATDLHSVTLAWTAVGEESSWNIAYGSAGFDPDSTNATIIPANTNPFTVDNLTSGTTYDFYVQADCDGGDVSFWAGPVTVTPGTYNMPVTGTNSITACELTIYDDGGANGDYSSSCESYLTINPTSATSLVSIQGTLSTESCCDYLRIYDGAGVTGTMFGEYKGSNVTIPELTSSTGPITLHFHSDGSIVYSGFELTVSCISNTCPIPTGLTVSNVTTTSADLSWTPGGTETTWNLEYKEATATTWTPVVVTGTPSHQLTNLTVGTSYDIRVQADCAADDQSLWLDGSFTTVCELISVLPYTEDFNSYTGTTYDDDNGIAPDCWVTTSNNTTYGAPHIIGSGSYFYASSGNSMVFTCGANGADAYAALPTFSAALNTLNLTFWRAMESTSSGTLTVGYVTDINNMPNSFVTVATIPSVSSSNGDTISVNFAAAGIPATGNICFHWNYTTSYYSCCIDDINVSLAGSGPVVTDPSVATNGATGIGQTNATLNATITNPSDVTITAKGFQWKASTGGTYTTVNGTGTGNSFTAALTGLTPNTDYTYKAFITFNGQTVEGSEMTFTTQEQGVEPCDVPTGLHTTDIQNESISIAWDANPNVTSWNIQYRPVGGQLSSASSNTNSYTITGLTMDTQYEIQVQAVCASGTSDWCTAITAQTTNVGIESWLSKSVILYPNPAKEVVNVQCTMNNVQSGGELHLFDVYGKLLQIVPITGETTQINVSGLANGMYFVRVTTEEGTVTKQFVKR